MFLKKVVILYKLPAKFMLFSGLSLIQVNALKVFEEEAKLPLRPQVTANLLQFMGTEVSFSEYTGVRTDAHRVDLPVGRSERVTELSVT